MMSRPGPPSCVSAGVTGCGARRGLQASRRRRWDSAAGRLAALHQGLAHVLGSIIAAVGAPAAKRSLPCCSSFSAASGFTAMSAPVRTPCMPWSAAAPLNIEGGRGMLDSSSWACCGLFPKNSTLPVSKS